MIDRKLILALGIVLLVTFALVLYNEWPNFTGKRMLLATTPIDPFDPFLGQYMQIGYEISDLHGFQYNVGDTLYVSLIRDQYGIYRRINVSKVMPDGDFIRGEVENGRIVFGIERYYFERDAKINSRIDSVQVTVDKTGRAKIIQLVSNGKPVEIDYKNVGLVD